MNGCRPGRRGGTGSGLCGWALAAVLASTASAPAAAQPRELNVIEDFGPGSYWPAAISPDGRIVSALVWPQFGSIRYVRWVDGHAEVLLSTGGSVPASGLNAMTPDGAAIVGRIQGGFQHEAFLRNASGFQRLGFLQPVGSYYSSEAKDVSADGRRVVGWSFATVRIHAVQWIDGAISELPTPDPNAQARSISDDGRRIVGVSSDASGSRLAIWDDGAFRAAGDPVGGAVYVDPRAMLADGSLVAGAGDFADGRRAFVWDGAAFHALGQLPGGDLDSTATGIGGAGEVIVGYATQAAGAYCQGSCPDVRVPFLWTPQTGMRPLREYLQYACGYDLERWAIAKYSDPVVSETGRFIAFSILDPQRNYGIAVAEIGEFCDPDYAVPANPIEPGDLLVASHEASVVRVDAETGAQAFVSQGGYLYNPRYLAQGRDGELLVLDSGRVVDVEVATGAQRLITWLQSNPSTLAVTARGRVFFPEWRYDPYPGKARIVELDPSTGATHPVYEGPGLGRGDGPLVAGRDGSLYYRGESGGTAAILRIDPDTAEQQPIAVGNLPGLNSMTMAPDDRLVFLDYAGIHFIHSATGARSTVVPDVASVSLPFLISFATSIDSRGRLLVADPYQDYVSAADLETGAIDIRTGHLLLAEPRHAIELRAACSDGFDNDGDEKVDYPLDPGCAASDGASEANLDLALRISFVGLRSGLIAVVVLGAADFDVRSLEAASFALGPGAAASIAPAAGPRLDTNRDGHRDWRLYFRSSEAEVPPGTGEACLRAATQDGTPAYGCAEIGYEACGMGFEVVFALLPLGWLRARRRRNR